MRRVNYFPEERRVKVVPHVPPMRHTLTPSHPPFVLILYPFPLNASLGCSHHSSLVEVRWRLRPSGRFHRIEIETQTNVRSDDQYVSVILLIAFFLWWYMARPVPTMSKTVWTREICYGQIGMGWNLFNTINDIRNKKRASEDLTTDIHWVM